MPDEFTYYSITEAQYADFNGELEKRDTLDVIRWAFDTFGDEVVYSCSFGAEGMVLLDLISKVKRDARIIFIDTHVHFQETYELIERVKQRYPVLNIQSVEPELTLERQSAEYGGELWLSQPDVCCRLRKVEPLARELKGVRAWFSGLRREQSPSRANTQIINKDDKFHSIKICPLVRWTWEEIWTYIRSFELTYNVLHDNGYPSIGCSTCTVSVEGTGDSRAGRWAHTHKTECGLHA